MTKLALWCFPIDGRATNNEHLYPVVLCRRFTIGLKMIPFLHPTVVFISDRINIIIFGSWIDISSKDWVTSAYHNNIQLRI
jgi:hypothetical protein